jgi:hypothetical protein
MSRPNSRPVIVGGAPMQFPTQAGGTVEVTATPGSSAPYDWACSAGHQDDHPYAALPFARDDAKAHASECRTPGGAA